MQKDQITAITLGRTLNVGNYESVRFDLTTAVQPNETFDRAMRRLQKEVDATETQLRREYRGKAIA